MHYISIKIIVFFLVAWVFHMKLDSETSRKIRGEIYLSKVLFSMQIQTIIMLERASLMRKFKDYRSVKLHSKSP